MKWFKKLFGKPKDKVYRILTVDDVKYMRYQYRWVVCDMFTDYPLVLCESSKDAYDKVDEYWKCCGRLCKVVDLWFLLKVGEKWLRDSI